MRNEAHWFTKKQICDLLVDFIIKFACTAVKFWNIAPTLYMNKCFFIRKLFQQRHPSKYYGCIPLSLVCYTAMITPDGISSETVFRWNFKKDFLYSLQ